MVTTTTVYSFQKPDVSGDEDAWGGYLNANVDKYESILTGNTTITSVVITTADINGGTLDNVVIGGSTAAAITGTTITGTGFVSSGNMTFGDNNKALFGASSDLEVYHNGTNSVIYDNGTGNLQLVSGGASVDIIKAGGENMANFATDGAVTLYYDNAVKITTATTGAIILHDNGNYDDGLTLRSTKNWGYGTSLSFDAITTSGGSNGTVGKIQSRWQSTGNHALDFYTYGGGSLTKRARLDNEGNLGVGGNTSPSSYNVNAHQLVIGNGSDSQGITIATGSNQYANIFFADGTSGTASYAGFIQYNHDTDKLYFGTSGSNRVVIDSSGIDVTGNATFADNGKAIFGAGSDLSIYHDGSHSYISDQGTGNLRILAAEFNVKSASGNTDLIYAVNGGSVYLYHNGNVRITTNATGTDFVGTVTADGLTVNSGTDNEGISVVSTDAGSYISVADNGTTGSTRFGAVSNDFKIDVNSAERLRITSAGSVGIGTSSPNTALEVKQTSGTATIRVHADHESSSRAAIELMRGTSDTFGGDAFTDWKLGQVGGGSQADFAIISSDTTRGSIERLTLEYDTGNVGIGTSSPSAVLQAEHASNATIDAVTTGGATTRISSASTAGYLGTTTNHPAIFITNGSERLRIDSSGNVGIGTAAPSSHLHVKSTSDNIVATRVSTNSVDALFQSIESASLAQIGTVGSHAFTFFTANQERMRIDSGGNLLVGKTSASSATVGFEAKPTGFMAATRSGDTVAVLNRTSSNGTILDLRKDGSSIGSLGTGAVGGTLYIEGDSVGSGLQFGNANIYPRDAGALSDNGIDLGHGSYRWKDLYLSGGLRGDTLTFSNLSGSERLRIDSYGNVGIGNTNPTHYNSNADNLVVGTTSGHNGITISSGTDSYGSIYFSDGTSGVSQYRGIVQYIHSQDQMRFYTNSAQRMVIDSGGNLLVGKTSDDFATEGTAIRGSTSGSKVTITRDGNNALALNRLTSDGSLINLHRDDSGIGAIGVTGYDMYLGTTDTGLRFVNATDSIEPLNTSTLSRRDNAIDLGSSSYRFDDIYATNGTIQTSDRNEKQDIAELTDAEQRVAVAAKGLLRKFRWKDKVAEKGDEARTHFGIIAQDLQAAFAAEGLDASDYAMFISTTWTDEETGEERTRMGVRYSELLAFIIAAI